MINAPKPQRELIPEGTYRATLYRVLYLGTIKTEYMGETKWSPKIDFTFELNDEMKVWKDGEEAKPQVISKEYTVSMGKKSNLRPLIEGIVGGLTEDEAYAFNFEDMLGKQCMLAIRHTTSETGKKRETISTSQFPKGMEKPVQFNESKLLSYDNWSDDLYNSLPQFLKDKISGSQEYAKKYGHDKLGMDVDDADINAVPF